MPAPLDALCLAALRDRLVSMPLDRLKAEHRAAVERVMYAEKDLPEAIEELQVVSEVFTAKCAAWRN